MEVLVRFTSLEEHGIWQGDRDVPSSEKHKHHRAVHHAAREPYASVPCSFPLLSIPCAQRVPFHK